MKEVCGIPCYLRKQLSIDALRTVLHQVENKCSRDFQDLQRLVREVSPFNKKELATDPGTCGQWFEDCPNFEDPTSWGYGIDRTPGRLKLNENDLSVDCLVGVIAHELGHAATRQEDRSRRGDVFKDEWREEFAADWYAYKWGFGREVAMTRKSRDWPHHGVAPGKTFEVDNDGKRYFYYLSRNFVCRLIKFQ